MRPGYSKQFTATCLLLSRHLTAWIPMSVLLIILTGCDHSVTTEKSVSIDTQFQRVVVEIAGYDTPMNLDIVGSDRIGADIDLTLHHSDDAPFEAGIVEEAYDFVTSVENETLVIRLRLNDNIFCLGGDLKISAPSRVDAAIDLTNTSRFNKGRIVVERVFGDVDIRSDNGEVALVSIEGNVSVTINRYGSVTLDDIRGNINVTALRSADIALTDVVGDIDMRVRYGEIVGDGLTGEVGIIRTFSGGLTLLRVRYSTALDLLTHEGDVNLELVGTGYNIDPFAPNGAVDLSADFSNDTEGGSVSIHALSGNIQVSGLI